MSLKPDISVNRTMRKKTFDEKGLEYVGELMSSNIADMGRILKWNLKHDIKLYRMSSDMMPWMSEYSFEELPNFSRIQKQLTAIGKLVMKHGIRVSFHPGPHCVLGSMNPDLSRRARTIRTTILELNQHDAFMNLMGLPATHDYPINIHVRSTTPSKRDVCDHFVENFSKLSVSARCRLTVENDDKVSQYSVKDLYELIYDRTGIPICFDTFHFTCGSQDQTYEEALSMAASTWSCKPLFHHSSSRKLYEDADARVEAHADYVYDEIRYCGIDFDVDLEAKAKELAVLRYKKQYGG
jgi:UV DNA damage endonuclease